MILLVFKRYKKNNKKNQNLQKKKRKREGKEKLRDYFENIAKLFL